MDVGLFGCDYKKIQNNLKVVVANNGHGIELYMQTRPYESDLYDVTKFLDQIYTYNVGERQEIIEQREFGNGIHSIIDLSARGIIQYRPWNVIKNSRKESGWNNLYN